MVFLFGCMVRMSFPMLVFDWVRILSCFSNFCKFLAKSVISLLLKFYLLFQVLIQVLRMKFLSCRNNPILHFTRCALFKLLCPSLTFGVYLLFWMVIKSNLLWKFLTLFKYLTKFTHINSIYYNYASIQCFPVLKCVTFSIFVASLVYTDSLYWLESAFSFSSCWKLLFILKWKFYLNLEGQYNRQIILYYINNAMTAFNNRW